MGDVRHDVIIVTCWDGDRLKEAQEAAFKICDSVSGIVPGKMNGYRSFVVLPDGSKEGWRECEEGNRQRSEMIKWLEDRRFEDGSSSLDWVEVRFEDPQGAASIVSSSDMPVRDREAGGDLLP